MSTQQVLATYEYDAYKTYDGHAYKGIINFRGVKGTQFAINWLMESLIVAKCKLANVTPINAILKVNQIKEDYLDYVTDDYELTLYYHESPSILAVVYAVATALAAAGFIVLAFNSTPTVWNNVSKSVENITDLPKSLAISTRSITYSIAALLGLLLIYKKYGK